MSETTRIHLSGLPQNATKEDITALISKVCPVVEVHIPEPDSWGFRRNFAVIRVKADTPKVQHCIKSFNGSMWKGNKIRLDFAKEWYKDRIQREKDTETDRLKHEEIEKQKEKVIDIMAESFTGEFHHSNGKHLFMLQKLQQTLPKLSNSMLKIRRAKTMKSLKICKTPKIIFNNEIVVSKEANSVCKPYSSKIIFDEDYYNEIKTKEELVPIQTFFDKLKAGTTASKATAPKKKDVDSKDNGKEKKDKDGSTSQPPSSSSATSAPSATVAAPSTATPASTAPSVPKIGGKGRVGFGTLLNVPLPDPIEKRVDCCIDDEKIGGKRNYQRVSEYDEFGPNSLEIVEIEDDTPCVPAELLEDSALEKERNRALDFAMSILKKAEEKQSTAKKPENKRDQRQIQQQPKKEELKEQQKVAPTPAVEAPVTDNSDVTDAQPNPESSNGNFVNLSTFKNIFHKDGGVWWNDNEAIHGETQIRGELENDVLFKTAEKMGFDIREPKGASLFNFNLDGNEPVPVANDKTVVFNFFGDSNASNNATADSSGLVSSSVDTRKRKAEAAAPHAVVKPMEEEFELIEDDIIVLAKQFCRDQ